MDQNLTNVNLLESLIECNGTISDRISKTEVLFTQICRTCLSQAKDNDLWYNIFFTKDSNGTSLSIKDMIEVLSEIRINAEDKMPHHICHRCLRAVEDAYSFRANSQRIDEILKRLVKQIYTPSKETHAENKLISCTDVANPMESEKIDETTVAIHVEGYQVSYVKEEFGSSSFQCNSCDMIFTTQIDLDKHKTEHVPTEGIRKLFKCGICPKEYSFRNGLHNHMMSAHVQTKQFPCNQCNMNFANQIDLEKHNTEHGPTDSKKKPFKCGICSKEYSFRNGLHNHIITAHIQKKEFQCPVCGKMFKKRDRLLQHKKSLCIAPYAVTKLAKPISQITVHPVGKWLDAANIRVEIKNVSCSLCEVTFELEGDFINHLPGHSTEKRCPYCKKFFSRPLNLETHVRSHTSERPFVCPLCSKGFSATRTLRNHLKLHTRRQGYECNTCGKKYVSEKELVTHTKSHEQEPVSVDLDEYEEAISFAEKMSLNSNDCKEGVFKEELGSPIDLDDNNDRPYKIKPGITSNKPSISSVSCSTSSQSICKSEEEAVIFKKENVEVSSASDKNQLQPFSDESIWEEPPIGFDITVKEEKLDDCHSAFEVTNEPLSDDETSFDQDSTVNQEKSDDNHSTFKITNEPSICLEAFDQPNQEPTATTYTSFTCAVPECKIGFRYYRDIINHYTSQHCVGPPPFKCPVCTMFFPVKLDVRHHLKSHLTCEYKCPYCPRSYWQLGDLKIHLRTHTGERPYKCTKCPKRFKQRPALNVHIKTHNISKEYKCNICSKEFFSYNGLFLHTKSHTEIKELQCNICSKQFPTKTRLRRHQSGVCSVRALTKISNGS